MLAAGVHSPPVPAQHDRVQLAGVATEHRGRGVRRRAQRLGRLLLAAPGEPVLRPAARRAAAVHQPVAYLGRHQLGRGTSEHPRRVAAQPDQQDAHGAVRGRVRGDQPGLPDHGPNRARGRLAGRRSPASHQVIRVQRRERRVAAGGRAVGGSEGDRREAALASGRRGHDRAVPVAERGDPAREALRRDLDPAQAGRSPVRSAHFARQPPPMLTDQEGGLVRRLPGAA